MKNITNHVILTLSTLIYISLPLLLLYFTYREILNETSKICYFFGSIKGNFFPNTMILAFAQLMLIPISIQVGRLYKITTLRALLILLISWNILLFIIPLFFRAS